MNKCMILTFLIFCGFLSTEVIFGAYRYNRELCLPLHKSSDYQRKTFEKLLCDLDIDLNGYGRSQTRLIDVSADGVFGKFIKVCDLSTEAHRDFLDESVPFYVETEQDGDIIEIILLPLKNDKDFNIEDVGVEDGRRVKINIISHLSCSLEPLRLL